MPPSKLLTFVNNDSCFQRGPITKHIIIRVQGHIACERVQTLHTSLSFFDTICIHWISRHVLNTAYLCFCSKSASSSAIVTFPKTNNIAPEKGWLEDQVVLLRPSLFSGGYVSRREGNLFILSLFSLCRGEFPYHPSLLIDDQLGVPFCRNRNSEHLRKTYWQHSPSPSVPTNKPVFYKLTL